MMRVIALMFSLAVCVAAMGQEPATPEDKAVSAILKLGGAVVRDEKLPGQPVVQVQLFHKPFTDSDLKYLKELKGLQMLNLEGTRITDAGLKDLRQLKDLHWLDLSGNQITDAGLKDLKEIKGLRELWLIETKTTDAGLTDLKRALPKLRVHYP